MGRLKAILGTLGAALLVLGLFMMFVSGPALNAQDGEQTPAPEEQSAPATGEPLDQGGYEGSRECQDCHRNTVRDHQGSAHALALQDTSRSQDPIFADFTAGSSGSATRGNHLLPKSERMFARVAVLSVSNCT